MALNFVGCDREQLLLMPPSLTEWLPEKHLVWTILGAVDEMDLGRFNEAYRLARFEGARDKEPRSSMAAFSASSTDNASHPARG